MKRTIAGAGALVALGFLIASALANYMFGAGRARSPWEAQLYGTVGVLAVAMNALAPFYISWSLSASRKTAAGAAALLWALCLTYSTTNALGFAAENREGTAVAQQVSRDEYEDTRRELFDLEARRDGASAKEKSRLDTKIDDVRRRLAAARTKNPAPADAQSQFLSALTRGYLDAREIRITLAALFAVMVEMCATLGLFVALSHSFEKPQVATPPVTRLEPRTRWTPKVS